MGPLRTQDHKYRAFVLMTAFSILQNRICLLVAAFILDLLLGDPRGSWHPVQGIGWLITKTECLMQRLLGSELPPARAEETYAHRPAAERFAGLLEVLIVCGASLAAYKIVKALLYRLHPVLGMLFGLLLSWQLIACRSMWNAAMEVYRPLREGDLTAARTAVSMIVGRDTTELDREGITRAAVESVAESTSDGVTAPLFFLALCGPEGMLLYKAVNTMDSMIGYRNERYRYFGTAAARLDDLLNYIPSRLTALLMILAAGILRAAGKTRYDPANALRVWRRDRRKHPSPNSAQTEAACAGALGVQLAGDARYFGVLHHKPTLGDPLREIEAEDIRRALILMTAASLLMIIFLAAVLSAVYSITA